MKKTPYFSAKINPVHIGWYEVKGCHGYRDCGGMHYWNGNNWAYGWGEGEMYMRIPTKALPWRGLTK